MAPDITQSPDRLENRLRRWGIIDVWHDQRGAIIETQARAEVMLRKPRASFTAECLDCGESPHVTIDDHAIAVCLRCGRDRWL